MDIDRLKKRVCKEVDKAQRADEIFEVVRKYSHILEDDQILKLFKSMHGMSSANDLSHMGIATRYLAPYIKDEWLQYIPEPVISYCSALKIRRLPTITLDIRGIMHYIVRSEVNPLQAYHALCDYYRQQHDVCNPAAASCNIIRNFGYSTGGSEDLMILARNGYFSGLPFDKVVDLLEWIKSVFWHYNPKTRYVSVIGKRDIACLKYMHYKVSNLLLDEMIEYCQKDISYKVYYSGTSIRLLKDALHFGMLAAKLRFDTKVNLAVLFPDIVSTRTFTREECEAIDRIRVADKLRKI